MLEKLRAADFVGQAFQPDAKGGKRQAGKPDLHALTPKERAPLTPRYINWPKTLSEQAGAVRSALASLPTGASAEELSKLFGRKNDNRAGRIEEYSKPGRSREGTPRQRRTLHRNLNPPPLIGGQNSQIEFFSPRLLTCTIR